MNPTERKIRLEKLQTFIANQYPQQLDKILRDELKACDETSETSAATSQLDRSRAHVWILNEFMVPNNMAANANIIDRSNTIRCKYGYLKANESLYNLKNTCLNLAVDADVPIQTSSPHLSLDLVPDLIINMNISMHPNKRLNHYIPSETFEYTTSHIHGFFAYDANIHFSKSDSKS